MILDMLYKLCRKSLNPRFYKGISHSIFGRSRDYHQAPTYIHIYDHYRGEGLEFGGRSVLEVGSGDQFFTALCYLADGATRVVLIDPKISTASFPGDLEAFNRATGRNLPADSLARIDSYRDLGEVPADRDSSIDVVCSHQVLEHFSDLESFFVHNRRLLSPSGISYNRVDLSDHTYHIFDKLKWTRPLNRRRAIYHLRYSRKTFARLNDPKCYMNRILLPTYLELAAAHGLAVRKLDTLGHRRVPVHRDLYSGDFDAEKLFITGFSITFARA